MKSGFSSLAGILCLAYFLHGLGHMITRNAKNPANNVRDIGIGYFLTFLTYAAIGIFGYYGFAGSIFPDGMIY